MRWIWQSSIARSILGGFIVFAIFVLAFSFILNSRSISNVRAETAKSYQNSISLLAIQMDDRVSVMSRVVDYMFTDTNILYLNYKENADVNQLFAYASLLDNLKFYANASLLRGEIRLYLKNKGKSFSSVTGYGEITDTDRSEVLDLNAEWTGHWRLDDDGLTFIRNPLFNRESKGIVAMAHIDRQEVSMFLNNLEVADPEANLFLMDIHGNGMFAREIEGVDKGKLFQSIVDRSNSEDQFILTSNGREYRIISGKSESSGLIVGMYFSEQYAMRTVSGSIRLTMLFSAFAIVLALIFTWIIYSKLLRPFHLLANGMHQVGKGDFSTRIHLKSDKDFGYIFRHFNRMASDTESLINEVYVERLNNQNTQLKLLQSRINPHFLYNCLNFIYQMSKGEDHEGAAQMASYLGKYFRYMAKSNKETISLAEECDNVVALLEIQRLRFNGRIRYTIDIPEPCRDWQVPSLIVQPLVENAIVHGLRSDQEGLFIRIAALSEGEGMALIVEDNGCGIGTDKLEEIRRNLQLFNLGSTGIGLNNTYWRLKLKYGNSGDLKLEQIEAGGLRVTLLLGPGMEAS